eukprot:1902098-Prymnesium_polylepis.1
MDSTTSLVISDTLAALGSSVVCSDGTNYSTPAAPLDFALSTSHGATCTLKLDWRSEGSFKVETSPAPRGRRVDTRTSVATPRRGRVGALRGRHTATT